MIRSLQLSNFKGFREAQIDFERLTLLVGPNASGKTSLLEAAWLLGQAAGYFFTDLDVEFRGHWAPWNLVRHEQSKATLLTRSNFSFFFEIYRTGARNFRIDGEDISSKKQLTNEQKNMLVEVREPVFFRMDVSRISRPSPVPMQIPSIDERGANLASYLQYLNNKRDGSLEAIEAAVRSVIPQFSKVSFVSTAMNPNGYEVPGIELRLELSGGTVAAEHASEGTLLILALLTAVLAPGGHNILLIDDLDRALHPAAQVRVLQAIRKAMEAAPELQIIATTHSPDLVDACDPSEVRVLGFDDKGDPAVAPLLSHPEAATWLKQLRPGEFWNSAGEDWVARVPRPSPSQPEAPPEAKEHG